MLIENLLANAALTKNAVGCLVGAVANVERTCECKDALATALITRRDRIPEKLKRELAPLVGKYLPVKPTRAQRKRR
jgi:hypothetical protein